MNRCLELGIFKRHYTDERVHASLPESFDARYFNAAITVPSIEFCCRNLGTKQVRASLFESFCMWDGYFGVLAGGVL